MMNRLFVMIIAIVLVHVCVCSAQVVTSDNVDTIINALHMKESSGKLTNIRDGDGGNAIGPFQIWRVYWIDACVSDKSLATGDYQDCRDYAYARRVVLAYMKRYATRRRLGHDATFEDWARIHNGGPDGFKSKKTDKYWHDVTEILASSDK